MTRYFEVVPEGAGCSVREVAAAALTADVTARVPNYTFQPYNERSSLEHLLGQRSGPALRK
jgi:hypothetical protein